MKRSKTLTPRLIKDLKQFSARLKLTQQQQSIKQIHLFQQTSKNIIKKQQSTSQFIPFIFQRKLGKLILPKQQQYSHRNNNNNNFNILSHPQILSQRINSRNFKYYYKKQKKIQEEEVISKTRIPEQKNLVYENQEWKKIGIRRNKRIGINMDKNIQSSKDKQKDRSKIKAKKQFKITHFNPHQQQQNSEQQQSHLRQCCRRNLLNYITLNNNSLSHHHYKNNFQKINQHLYKKINLFRPPSDDNPQLNVLFQHFANSCELNQNIRREIMMQKKKNTFRKSKEMNQ